MENSSNNDPYQDGFQYIVEAPIEITNKPPPGQARQGDIVRQSVVEGLFREIEEAEKANVGVHTNSTVMFAGLICPVIDEDANRVKIVHGHTEIWLPKTEAQKALSSKSKERQPGWNDVSTNPLVQPHRP